MMRKAITSTSRARRARGLAASLLLAAPAAFAAQPARGAPVEDATSLQILDPDCLRRDAKGGCEEHLDGETSAAAPAAGSGVSLREPEAPVAPVPSLGFAAEPPRDHRASSAIGLGGAYAALGTWMWVAWYRDQPSLPSLRFGGDGWLGERTYAGGADKVGHLWSNLVLSRLGTEFLMSGGWDRWTSSMIASGMSLMAFLLVEVNDGYHTEFSPGDMTANVLGVLAAVAMSNWPALDDAIDLRVQWLPSAAFRRHPTANFAEDYSGQTYLLAFKPRSIAAIRGSGGPIGWLQFVNPVVGFESRGYKPAPQSGDAAARRQEVFLGVTVDMQAAIDVTLAGRSSTAVQSIQGASHWLFEFVNPPSTALPVMKASRSPGVPAR